MKLKTVVVRAGRFLSGNGSRAKSTTPSTAGAGPDFPEGTGGTIIKVTHRGNKGSEDKFGARWI